jgi:TPR repeat protein
MKQDFAQALKYYEKAAELGNAKAMNNLGFMYSNGRGVKQDYKKAEEYFIKKANANPPPKPFGIAISKMTLEEFMDQYEAKYIGDDEYTDGKKYIATNLTQFNFQGLKALTVTFNSNVVSAITAEFYKNQDTFRYLYDNIREKDYYTIASSIPYVGDKYAKFILGGVLVELIANHLSHTVYIIYKTQAYDAQSSANILSKKSNQFKHEKDLL